MPDTRLAKMVLNWDMQQALYGKKTWCKDVLDLFDNTWGPTNNLNSFVGSENLYQRMEESLMQRNILDWQRQVETMRKLRTYKTVQITPTVAGYVAQKMSPAGRSVLARFRNSTFPLAIETGRYIGQSIDKRICTSCDRNSVETEIHFRLQAERYHEKRTSLWQQLGEKINIDLSVRN